MLIRGMILSGLFALAAPAADEIQVCILFSEATPPAEIRELAVRWQELLGPACSVASAASTNAALDRADVFVLSPGGHLLAHNPTIIEDLVRRRKGIVVLGPIEPQDATNHFAIDLLGGTAGDILGPPSEQKLRSHPILRGAEDCPIVGPFRRYSDLREDVQIVIEARVAGRLFPIAWVREREGSRLFFHSSCSIDMVNAPPYERLLRNAIRWAARRSVPGVGTRVQRTWMPSAFPGSFAVGFPCGLNACFDPVRATLAYAWDGDFVDLHPTIAGKLPRDAIIRGKIFHQGPETHPFAPADAPVRFLGYRVVDGNPEFHYTIAAFTVRETIQPAADRMGVTRRFEVYAPGGLVEYRPAFPDSVVVRRGTAARSKRGINISGSDTLEFTEFLPLR